jgi:hypothetical protein
VNKDPRAVQGYCPMGCGRTLFLDDSGHIVCSWRGGDGCPNPTAVDVLLAERETEHVVKFDDVGFVILHPLRERLDDLTAGDDLWDCSLHAYVQSLPGPPVRPGRYRARSLDGAPPWSWEALP